MAQPLQIGKYTVRYPLIQGGMGARISAGNLAGHIAKCGGVGLVAAAGIALNSEFYDGKNFFQAEIEAFKEELRKAYEIAPDGIIGVNVMVALSDYAPLVKAAVEGGAKIIVCGAGLPMGLPELTADHPDVALVPIVSSLRAAQLIVRKWQKSYHRLPDALVVEDPDTAGGHLGEKMENIGTGEYDQYATVRSIKAFSAMSAVLMYRLLPQGGSGTEQIWSTLWLKGLTGFRWQAALSAPRNAMLMRGSSSCI